MATVIFLSVYLNKDTASEDCKQVDVIRRLLYRQRQLVINSRTPPRCYMNICQLPFASWTLLIARPPKVDKCIGKQYIITCPINRRLGHNGIVET